MNDQKLPRDWDENRIQDVIAHYDEQIEDEQSDEIEAALTDENITMMAVPTDRVAEVQALLSRGASA